MKKHSILFIGLVLLLVVGSVFGAFALDIVGLSVSYLVTAVSSLIILLAYTFFSNKKDRWYILLFCSVFCVNTAYLLLSVSKTIEFALWANRLSYLGSVFLPYSLTMIVFDITELRYPRRLGVWLGVVGVAVFAITATPGICGIYYKAQTLVIQDGVSFLEKQYGPLHNLYFFYLAFYFGAMVFAVIRSYFKNKQASVTQEIMLSVSAFINIIVWFVEKFIDNSFEILSVSYVICELFLIGLAVIANENERLRSLVKSQKEQKRVEEIDRETLKLFHRGVDLLTNTERTIFNYYVSGSRGKDVMEALFITENTLKFHNKNIYAKLGVGSRKRLVEIYNYINNQ